MPTPKNGIQHVHVRHDGTGTATVSPDVTRKWAKPPTEAVGRSLLAEVRVDLGKLR